MFLEEIIQYTCAAISDCSIVVAVGRPVAVSNPTILCSIAHG